MADEGPDRDEAIHSFMDLTNATAAVARAHLIPNEWNLEAAVTEYFASLEEGGVATEPVFNDQDADMEEPEEPYTGPRTLDGRPAPQAIPAAGSSAPPKKKGGIATLGSIAPTDPHAGHAHDSDDSDDEDFEPDEEPRDLFAGGEKSGLAVQDPSQKRLVKDILKKARANAQRPGGESSASAAPPSRFRGGGVTLGGDDAPSRRIPDPHPQAPEPGPTQTRILHLWEDGFSIEDGPLRRFSDPQHAADLAMIRDGRAPLHLMGVRPDQPVDVQLIKHDEDYKPQPKKYKPFSGQGHRLGSPTPGPSGASTTTTTTSYPASTPAATPAAAPAAPSIDSSQPTISLRIQLANGTRLPARFNPTHTIGDIYGFIQSSSADSNDRPWVLATTFPNKDHTDKSLQLGDVAEFKRGGTAVQKWT